MLILKSFYFIIDMLLFNKFIYSHLFNYDLTKMRDRKEVKNGTDYTLS